MKREIIKIDEELCNGCGDCVPNCHEGALQVIDGKVRLVSELMCDGLGACIGHCPLGAIEIEEREAQPYDEVLTIKEMLPKGKNTIIAHLKHLKDHGQKEFVQQAITYLKENETKLNFNLKEVIMILHDQVHENQGSACGCPGSRTMSFAPAEEVKAVGSDVPSALRQWPVQFHLVNTTAPYFQNADVLIAADCVAFALGNFHQKHLPGKAVAIACPKLDSDMDVYVNKVTKMVDEAKINTITVMIMEVPCCGGLLQMVRQGVEQATRKIPIKLQIVGIQGDIKHEEWV